MARISNEKWQKQKNKKEKSEDFIGLIVINWKEEQSGRKWAH